MTLELREATADDAELLFDWRNDPAARESSFHSAELELDAHRQWLARKLAARDTTRIWIAVERGTPIGQIRYDVAADRVADISFSIDAFARGRGLGAELLRLSAPHACSELHVTRLRGYVKPSNVASVRAFERAGFRRDEADGDPLVFLRDC